MRFLVILVCLFVTGTARAQVIEIGELIALALKAERLYDNHQTNREKIQILNDMSENVERLLVDNKAQLITEIGQIPYKTMTLEILHRSNANRIRIEEYVTHCQKPSDWCETELDALLLAGRETSADARTLDMTPLTVSILVLAQESELLLSRHAGSEDWRDTVVSGYEAFWQEALDRSAPDSIAQQLAAAKQEQAEAISDFAGLDYLSDGIASMEEFQALASWLNTTAMPALYARNAAPQERLTGCLVRERSLPWLGGALRPVASISDGKAVEIYRGYLTAHIASDAASRLTFDYKIETDRTRYRPAQNLMQSVFSGGTYGCALAKGAPERFEKRMRANMTAWLGPIETTINERARDIEALRLASETARSARRRVRAMN